MISMFTALTGVLPATWAFRYNLDMKMLFLGFLSVLALNTTAATSYFEEAKVAASEGRYDEVTTLLSAVIESGQLEPDRLAIAHSNRGIAFSLLEQYERAIVDLKRAIELDPAHLLTLNHLGILAEHLEADSTEAARWYRRAARLIYPASQVNLANLLKSGRGVGRDPDAAAKLYEQAAAQGCSLAMVGLGEMYLRRGIARDEEHAISILQEAVEAGSVVAHHHPGVCL